MFVFYCYFEIILRKTRRPFYKQQKSLNPPGSINKFTASRKVRELYAVTPHDTKKTITPNSTLS
ncbi:MAG TPA: hypothetical protein DER09_13990 [Prolixibacteraceae bacterium]|nr:hypothetical protein [Prolixibacteraceae bacterium]